MFSATAKTLIAAFVLLISNQLFAAPVNDAGSSAALITASTSCTTIAGDLYSATETGSPTSSVGTTYDVWYTFSIPSGATSSTISVSLGNSTNLSTGTTYVEVFNASTWSNVSASNSLGASAITNSNLTGPNLSGTYYVRVFTTTNPTGNNGSSNKFGFNICISYIIPPANDACANAVLLTSGSSCTNTGGTLSGASSSNPTVASTCSGTPGADVWYKFVAQTAYPTISLNTIGTSFSAAGAYIQLLSGTCGSFTPVVCTSGTTTSLSLSTSALTIGATYYVRIYSPTASPSGSNWSFNICVTEPVPVSVQSSRMNEVFQQTTLSPANGLYDPWEITYGSDGYLWITEARGYKLYRMDPNTGVKNTVLDISQNSTFFSSATDQAFNVQFSSSQNPWPQGGFAGMALHPKFLDPVAPKNYVYVSYVHQYDSTSVTTNGGVFFTNRVVRFTYNTTTGLLESPVSLCDTLPGSSDHNSQRMIIAPVNGTYYLFYAQGDMGAGQFGNTYRTNKAQNSGSYEGKILRFNLESDGDAGTLDKWIPNDNPFNVGLVQSAVWSTGIRNNQGFAYANINGTDYLYGTSHGPFSDDEVNIIQRAKNYGHPIVIGFNDGNYNNAKAGGSSSSLPLIVSEAANASAIGASYTDPIYTFYPAPAGNTTTAGTIQYIYSQFSSGNQANGAWPSEAPSGLDIYTKTIIPGWKNSLLLASLKGGKVIRLKLNSSGNGLNATVGSDTINYFRSVNRFRDVAISPDGSTIFTIIDKSSTTSGPTTGSPIVSACAGCVLKYTFLGYNADGTGRSTIPTSIDITTGTANTCNSGTTITINNTNNNIWVPITGPDGNIMAEIKANGNNLGTVTSSFYLNSGAVRQNASKRLYSNRNLTITPQTQPSSAVSIRLYITSAELAALKTAVNSSGNSSGVNSIGDVSILKNSDPCGAALTNTTLTITPVYAEAFGANGYVLQGNINSFSSFYFGNPNMSVLPLQLLYFKGALQNQTALLQWETANEINTSQFIVERSVDGSSFNKIGTLPARGNGNSASTYSYPDNNAALQGVTLLYYRLKIVDINGAVTYSKVITITLAASEYTLSVYPNPIHDMLKVKLTLSKADNIHIEITDVNGRTIYQHSKFAAIGTSELEIDTKTWTPQLYSIKITGSNNNMLFTEKVVKQ